MTERRVEKRDGLSLDWTDDMFQVEYSFHENATYVTYFTPAEVAKNGQAVKRISEDCDL